MVYYLIEFLDELIFGVSEATWPFIKSDLGLTYTQIGILMTVPGIFSTLVEPFLGILGDVWKRRLLILGGGACYALALVLTGMSHSFGILLIAFMLTFPASGAFVSLAQASLMDTNPSRHDHNMARWTLAGSLGVVLGPALLVGMSALGFGWRGAFLALAFLAGVALVFAWRKIPADALHLPKFPSAEVLFSGFREAFKSLKNPGVLRWLVLLEFSDLMLDVLLGFLALYFHDVAGLSETGAASAVLVWLICGLLGDFLLIPLLEKVDGLRYLRVSVVIELVLFPVFLLVPWIWFKLVLAGILGFFNSGWYAILQGRLYTSMPGKSGSALAIGNITGVIGGLLPFFIGLAADAFGLQVAIWMLLAGPIALLVGLPKRSPSKPV